MIQDSKAFFICSIFSYIFRVLPPYSQVTNWYLRLKDWLITHLDFLKHQSFHKQVINTDF